MWLRTGAKGRHTPPPAPTPKESSGCKAEAHLPLARWEARAPLPAARPAGAAGEGAGGEQEEAAACALLAGCYGNVDRRSSEAGLLSVKLSSGAEERGGEQ